MSHICFVVSNSVDNLLLEVFQLKEDGFDFIGDRCNEKRKILSYVGDNGFKIFSGVNRIVCSVSGWSVARYINKDCYWVLSQIVQSSGPDIQGRIAFSCS